MEVRIAAVAAVCLAVEAAEAVGEVAAGPDVAVDEIAVGGGAKFAAGITADGAAVAVVAMDGTAVASGAAVGSIPDSAASIASS